MDPEACRFGLQGPADMALNCPITEALVEPARQCLPQSSERLQIGVCRAPITATQRQPFPIFRSSRLRESRSKA